MRYELVWGHVDFYGMDETKINGSSDLDFLEEAQNTLSLMSDYELMEYLEIDELILNEGIYFRIKTV